MNLDQLACNLDALHGKKQWSNLDEFKQIASHYPSIHDTWPQLERAARYIPSKRTWTGYAIRNLTKNRSYLIHPF